MSDKYNTVELTITLDRLYADATEKSWHAYIGFLMQIEGMEVNYKMLANMRFNSGDITTSWPACYIDRPYEQTPVGLLTYKGVALTTDLRISGSKQYAKIYLPIHNYTIYHETLSWFTRNNGMSDYLSAFDPTIRIDMHTTPPLEKNGEPLSKENALNMFCDIRHKTSSLNVGFCTRGLLLESIIKSLDSKIARYLNLINTASNGDKLYAKYLKYRYPKVKAMITAYNALNNITVSKPMDPVELARIREEIGIRK